MVFGQNITLFSFIYLKSEIHKSMALYEFGIFKRNNSYSIWLNHQLKSILGIDTSPEYLVNIINLFACFYFGILTELIQAYRLSIGPVVNQRYRNNFGYFKI